MIYLIVIINTYIIFYDKLGNRSLINSRFTLKPNAEN